MTFSVVEFSTHASIRNENVLEADMERVRVLIEKAKRKYGHPLYDDQNGRGAVINFLKSHDPEDLGNWAHLAKTFIEIANTMWL